MDSGLYQDLKSFLLLNRLKLDGRRRAAELFGSGKGVRDIFDQMASEELLGASAFSGAADFSPEKEIEACHEKKIDLMTFADPAYPLPLKQIPDPPLVLYKRGATEEADGNAVAIVGTRHPSFYGRTQAKRFSKELAAKGLTVVSGLARGIDQAAHEAALEVPYGRTLAILGSGLDVIYPKENEKLFHQIAERGAVLSEYPLGMPPLPENFPRRNRIISGLACGVLVVEAHSRSGSLITAHQAIEQGREVFAVPGPVDQLTSRGTHQLLKEGACLAESPGDILEALAGHLKRENVFVSDPHEVPPVPVSQPEEMRVLGQEASTLEAVLTEEGPLTPDEILDFSGLEPSRLSVLLLQLELTRKIRRTAEGKYLLLKN